MKVLYLHQYFKTNYSVGGTRSYELAKSLIKNDYEVNVITGLDSQINENEYKNLKVHSTKTNYNNEMSKLRRILSFIDYNIKSLIKGAKIKDVDIVFATSTPLTIGLPAVLISKIKRKKLLFEVRDVWPDVPIEMGYINNKFLIKILKGFEKWIYNNANQIIVLSDGMYKNLMQKGVKSNKLTVIENMSNIYLYDEISHVTKNENTEEFICIHPGTMGQVNGLDFILDVANFIDPKENIIFLLIGEGNKKDYLINKTENEKISNVIFKQALPKNEIVQKIKESDLGIMCVDNKYKILEDNSANKFFDFLAAGLPIFINYEGWQKEVLEMYDCGVSATQPEEMAKEIIKLKNNKLLSEQKGKNARALAENKYSDILAKDKFLEIIKSL